MERKKLKDNVEDVVRAMKMKRTKDVSNFNQNPCLGLPT